MKKKNTPTFLDRQIINKQEEFQSIKNMLSARIKDVIVKEKAVALYPDGADKEKAIDDLETAKQLLLCSVGSYDCRRMEFAKLLKKEGERNTTFGMVLPFPSHEYIECVIRELLF